MYEETNTLCTKHAMYLQSNTEALSSNHCCSGAGGGWGGGGNTYSDYVFVALGVQRAMRMRRIVICGVFSSTMYFHLTS